jgi:arabinofuranosyltransferase
MAPQLSASDIESPLRPSDLIQLALVSILGLVGLYLGWRLFWFLTDDAYIAFRYISNSLLGYGYVWNPPPFQPVEGYTSFFWVVLLDGIWRVLGIAPPDSANVVSLFFAGLTLLMGIVLAWRILMRSRLRRYRLLFSVLYVLWLLSNRTFLAWTSSGLETAMFNALIMSWVFALMTFEPYSKRWLFGISTASSLIYLTRPDGLLYVSVTAALILFAFFAKARQGQLSIRSFSAIAPLLSVPVHLLWRWHLYGAWLPNTYYAKSVSAIEPLQSGARYLLSFVIEYSLWSFFLPLIALLLLRIFTLRRSFLNLVGNDVGLKELVLFPTKRFQSLATGQPGLRLLWFVLIGFLVGVIGVFYGQIELSLILITTTVAGLLLLALLDLSFLQTILVLTLFLHMSYYTVIIGGDHFEFRVYSYLIPFLGLGFLWMLGQIVLRLRYTLLFFIGFVVLSWPIPWMHWSATHDLHTRQETFVLKMAVGDVAEQIVPGLPTPLEDYLRYYDRLQFWLIDHFIGMRHQEHKVLHEFFINTLPPRSLESDVGNGDYPIIQYAAVGVLSWVLPQVNVVDTLGLNDRIVARNPDLLPTYWIAHERMPPAGYFTCLTPNVQFAAGIVSNIADAKQLTASDIRKCESEYSQIVEERLADYRRVEDWLDQNVTPTQTIATTSHARNRELNARNVLWGEPRIKNWLHTLVFQITGSDPDYVVVAPYPHWDSVTSTWWFRNNYEIAEQFGDLSLFKRMDDMPGDHAFPMSVEYSNGLTLEQATVETIDLQPSDFVNVWLRFAVDQNLSTDYQMTMYLVNTQTDERTESQSSWPYGDYLFFPSSVWLSNSTIQVPIRVAVPEDLADGSYRLGLFMYDTAAGKGLPLAEDLDSDYPEVQFGYFRLGDPPASPWPEKMTRRAVDAPWQEGLTLTSVGVPDHSLQAGDVLPVHLDWQVSAQITRDLTVFLHLVNPAGEIIAQSDRKPFDGRFPTTVWRTDDELTDSMLVALPEELDSGTYSLRIGLYDSAGRLGRESGGDDSLLVEKALTIGQGP